MLPMLSGIAPVSWLVARFLQQWVGGGASQGWTAVQMDGRAEAARETVAKAAVVHLKA